MANKYRGEIDATLDGTPYTLCLTLGALAELEGAFGIDDMLALSGRFTQGRISAGDCIRIIGAGLRGAGHVVTDDAVAGMRGESGAAGFVDIVARLLASTFGGPIANAVVGVATDAVDRNVAVMAKAEVANAPLPFASAQGPQPFPGPR